MLRILHTADWHLGHRLYGFSREKEHQAFCSWLLRQLQEQDVDVLLIAGDIFDSANPPASAQAIYYSFLAQLNQHCPRLDVVIIAGNHDSPSRLEAPSKLLSAMGVHVVGAVPCDLEDCIVPLHDAKGEVAAYCAAVPFLRPADLPLSDEKDPLIDGVRQVYEQVERLAAQKAGEEQALIAMGHAYMVGTALSELSERKILGGNQHALPVEIFSENFSYVALGHLHRPQGVASRRSVRYSGSPVPLAMDEAAYAHQALLIELDGKKLRSVESLHIPRAIELLRLPEGGPASLEDLFALIEKLPEGQAKETSPYLELRISLDGPDPSLRETVEKALEGKAVRLCRIALSYSQEGHLSERWTEQQELQSLEVDQVFAQCYSESYGESPPKELISCFHELFDLTQQEGGL